MDLFRAAERLMAMDDAAWARHANPASVWSRLTCLPLLALALYSRGWIGWWALAPTGFALAWIWVNPRLFSPPRHTDNWASKGVLGERLFLNRKASPIPEGHRRAGLALTGLSILGLGPLAWGLIALDPWATLAGLSGVMLPKLWFLDRMVWLYEDMAAQGVGNGGRAVRPGSQSQKSRR